MSPILTRTIALKCSPAHAFEAFTQKIDLWWPKTHRKDSAAVLVLDGGIGGRLYERSPNGDEWTIGEIIDWVPGKALAFNWFPGSPAAPTTVAVTFGGDAESSEILIEHSALSAGAIEVWPDRVALFARGWDTILPLFQLHCETDQAGK